MGTCVRRSDGQIPDAPFDVRRADTGQRHQAAEFGDPGSAAGVRVRIAAAAAIYLPE